ncbi:MAG: nitroreductase family deazaflavin-dependent oxidoreductase [Myxococcota bacterium]
MAQGEMTEREFKTLRRFIKPYSNLNVRMYRWTSGRIMGKFQGYDVMLVNMTGAKSGEPRTVPLMYVPHNDGVIVVASQGGAPKEPVWANNLRAHPEIEVQYKSQVMPLRAREVDDAEKAEVWPTCVKYYPPFEDYQARTKRNIPVFVCEPR